MPEPAVTAIIIVYNGAAFLAEAVESVIGQTFGDWELLIVDDGSRDASLELAGRFAALHPGRIRSLRHPDHGNHGMSATRNVGIAAARGRYVAFLDCDDVWLPEKLAEQVATMEAEPSLGMIYGRTLIWHSWQEGAPPGDHFYDLGVAPGRDYDPPILLFTLLENQAQTPTTCNALMRTDLVRQVGGFEPRFRGMFEDQAFFAKILLRARVHVADRCWAKYRQHAASHSAASARRGEDLGPQVAYLSWFLRYVLRTDPQPRVVMAVLGKLARQGRWLARRSLRRGVKRAIGRA
jgi:glycosyltransferase involved in cell wall biosynthesis